MSSDAATIAIVSTTGGAGRSTLTAELASLLAWRKHAVLALECDPRNVLGFHFGLRDIPADGIGAHLHDASPSAWAASGQRSDDGVLFVPWGDSAELGAIERLPANWLARQIEQVDLSRHGAVLIDTAPWPSAYANQAIDAADLVLVLMPTQPETCLTIRRLTDSLATRGKTARYLATRLQPARQLDVDIVAMLQAMLGNAMLPYHVHEDSSVPQALARSECFSRSTPHSQAAHDLNGLASWLSAWIESHAVGGSQP
ncbi:cellulose biosynthesis protein BcsQ [Cupriavidus pauculus]|uniref:cellulose biosynthesis protein BcsQ n=1 Tax=Cupriavidus pauculus TaxID=82633 RepID=UPI001EE33280|nr:cellulose biosynthesis protein BcsQ [Cupriavidus pauculus]GJG96321.1 cellulose synthase operon protein YhjQ [Cupriavidus pauculus]